MSANSPEPNVTATLMRWSVKPKVPAALQGFLTLEIPTRVGTFYHGSLAHRTPVQSTVFRPLALGTPIRLLGWPRTRSSFRHG
ncbi:hypothetical protein PoB_000342800 [Plakobranchus ocellatus]|uniref:Uncharacterized protein n=1 Tax=Plakobranchus ocellatus TaxID=259542 RepID=A0AAV3Y2T2_9GAST|nr:hypothetical protein PoB_000342800 [Plakobranchus ocellatus]